jgi:predicted anti-sigma-YlaC factor YlaD
MSRLRFRPRRDVVCREAVELVADYLEDAMSQAQRRRLEAHLAHCPDCPEYLAQMRAIVALAGRVTPDDLTPRMREELIGLYLRWRDDEARDPL